MALEIVEEIGPIKCQMVLLEIRNRKRKAVVNTH